MRWPWEFLMKTKAINRSSNEEVISPARDEVQRSTDARDRIERILKEARKAQEVVTKQPMR